jgi:hypothetical protein
MNALKVEVIRSFSQFVDLKPRWDFLYQQDPHAQIFISWAWIKTVFESSNHHWLLLAVCQKRNLKKEYIAFLPLVFRHCRSPFQRIIKLAGNPYVDHTGMLCLPEYSEAAITKIFIFFKNYPFWKQLHMREFQDERLLNFSHRFSENRFRRVEEKKSICPCVPLPPTWEQYESEFLNPNTKYNLNRKRKKISNVGGFIKTSYIDGPIEEPINVLLSLWKERFDLNHIQIYKQFLSSFRYTDLFHIESWFVEDNPVAVSYGFLDKIKKTYSLYLLAFNENYASFSPGKLIILDCIKYAIEHQCLYFDFLRGAQSFKYSFGAVDRENFNFQIIRNGLFY